LYNLSTELFNNNGRIASLLIWRSDLSKTPSHINCKHRRSAKHFWHLLKNQILKNISQGELHVSRTRLGCNTGAEKPLRR